MLGKVDAVQIGGCMRVAALLMTLFLLTGCQEKTTTLISTVKFAEIYQDEENIVLFRFCTSENIQLYSSIPQDVTVISTGDPEHYPYIKYTINNHTSFARSIQIDVKNQSDMHLWRNAIAEAKPRVLFPGFEYYTEDEIK